MSLSQFITPDVLRSMRSNQQSNLLDMSDNQPIMLVFLRHFGCNFCREGLAQIARQRTDIESRGVRIVFVHMSNNKTAEKYFTKYQLEGIAHISDPDCVHYKEFGLFKGTMNQLYGLHTWLTGFKTVAVHGSSLGKMLGDHFQMPGVFMVYRREVVVSFVHEHVAQQPDYITMSDCCGTPFQ